MIAQLIQRRKESYKKLLQNVRRRNYEHRCQYLRDLGIDEEMVELEPCNPKAAIPDRLQQEINQKSAEKRAAENEKEDQRLKTLFNNTWLKEKEKEMQQMQLEIQHCPQGDRRKAKLYLLSTFSNVVQKFHIEHHIPVARGLVLRQQMCVELGILDKKHASLVTSVYEPLPLPKTDVSSQESLSPADAKGFLVDQASRKRQATAQKTNTEREKKKGSLWNYFFKQGH